MSYVFISYAREDVQSARLLKDALEERGIGVWWDDRLQAGEIFGDELQRRLEGARVVLVVWSRASVESVFVRDEAQYARDHNKLVPVVIDDAIVPLGYRQFQLTDLRGWSGNSDSPLVTKLAERVGGETGHRPLGRRTDGAWITLPREEARRHRLYGFSGTLLAVYLGVIVHMPTSTIIALGVRDNFIYQMQTGDMDFAKWRAAGWAEPDLLVRLSDLGLMTQLGLFVPFLLLPVVRLSWWPIVAGSGVVLGQILWPAFWSPQMQPLSTFLLGSVTPTLLVGAVAAYLFFADRVRVTYANQIRNELYR